MDKRCICENCEFRNLVFSSLDDATVQNLCDQKEEQIFRKGETIHHEGDKIYYFKYLKSGLVKLYRKTPSGEEQVVTITKPFEFVSNISVFSEDRYKYSVSAVEDSVICAIKLDFIKELLLKNAAFAMGLLSKVAKINEKIISQTLDIRQKEPCGKGCIYTFILFK